jgi:hypothetical protein
MKLKVLAAKLFAKNVGRKNAKWIQNPIAAQEKVFKDLITNGANTKFGKDHQFGSIRSFSDFQERVPVRDYEGLKDYVDLVVNGANDVLWPGKPAYFAKTSGTTSGSKYIPITKVSIKEQVRASRDAILAYIQETGNADFVTRKMIFLQGSPELDEKNGVKLGRLSGISAHYVPGYLQGNRLPSWETNCIEDWETKVEKIIDETLAEDMGVIAGIPSWVQMYFERITQRTGKKIAEVFPNFDLFIYGGVNYEPYRATFESLMGRKVDSIEIFPASEGFFAYQDTQTEPGLLLCVDSGIFYEFIKADEFYQENAKRYTLSQVELGVNYVLIISTNAGLWGYNIGDTVQFVSLAPYRVIVSGRIKHFISAFGEHVIGKEVEESMRKAIAATDAMVHEFTVAPQTSPPEGGLPYHEWLIEFEKPPSDMKAFITVLDQTLQEQNSYYFDLIEGKVLQRLKVSLLKRGAFMNYMKSVGRLGGQNKVQRLGNDRMVADALSAYRIIKMK